MKLKVVTYFWAVGKKTRRIKSDKYKLSENPIDFKLNQLPATAVLKDNMITIEVRNYKNDLIKTIEFEVERKYYYRPLSMDAGYEFVFKTCRF